MMSKSKLSVRDMCYSAIFAALMAVCAQIQIPAFGVPITLQTFAIFLALLTLGGFRGTVSVALYLLLGILGLPVFSGFRGGAHMLLLESGGFLIGFMLTSLLYWAISAEFQPKNAGKLLILALSMLPCYGLGIFWMFRFFSRTVTVWDYGYSLLIFGIPDAVKFVLAHLISNRLHRFVK
jgi:biotin transport system substrate-specific component